MKRRQFLRRSLQYSLSFSALAGLSALTGCSDGKTSKPNIVIFLADDTGWNDVGYHGSKIWTPNIDALAKAGVKLNQFYAYPSCSPSRAALITGRPPSRFGVHSPLGGDEKLELPGNSKTLPELLKTNGYQTAICGKWHLGMTVENEPREYGFDHSYGSLRGQIDQYTHRYKFGQETWHRNGELIKEDGHATDLIERESIDFIKNSRNKSKPFFLYVPFTVPHYPVQESEEWVGPYEKIFENHSRRLYAASMSHMDSAIGHIVNAIEDEDIRDNTLVIFMSDNGGQNSWSAPLDQYNGKFRENDQLGNNEPLRGWKTELYEGGIRVPAVLNWQGVLERGQFEQACIMYDMLPTLTDITDTPIPQDMVVEGVNIWDAVKDGTTLQKRLLYWRTPSGYALRRGDWKLIHHGRDINSGEFELFNLGEDPYETENVIESHPGVLADLRSELDNEISMDI